MFFNFVSSVVFLSNSAPVAAVGDAEDNLGDPEAEDEGRITRDSAVVAERKVAIVVLGRPVAKRGEFTPRVKAEHGGRDDGCQVEATAAASANAGIETSMHEPSTEEHQDRVGGKEHHSGASERVDLAEAVALIPAFITRTVCSALVNDLLVVLGGCVGIGAVVFSPHCFILIVITGQLVIEVTRSLVLASNCLLVAPPGAQDDSNDACEGNVDGPADSDA